MKPPNPRPSLYVAVGLIFLGAIAIVVAMTYALNSRRAPEPDVETMFSTAPHPPKTPKPFPSARKVGLAP